MVYHAIRNAVLNVAAALAVEDLVPLDVKAGRVRRDRPEELDVPGGSVNILGRSGSVESKFVVTVIQPGDVIFGLPTPPLLEVLLDV